MRALLDTQCWLWWIASPHRLSPEALRFVTDGANRVFFSAASAWEIAIKHALGKLALPEPPSAFVPPRLARDRFSVLAVTLEHALRVAELEPHHRDPFGRLLVAQSLVEDLPVITADPVFRSYPVTVIPGG